MGEAQRIKLGKCDNFENWRCKLNRSIFELFKKKFGTRIC